MPPLNSIHNILERLERKWFSEKPPFSEAVIEAALLLELFRDPSGLAFNEKSARREQDVATSNGCVDILLKLNRTTSVIVEIKQPGMLDIARKQWKKHLRQAGRYVRDSGQLYGILTDGVNWFYFKVLPYGGFHRLHPLVYFNVKTHRPLALRILLRSKKRTLHEFLDMVSALHCEMPLKRFNVLMNLGINERVSSLVNFAKEQNVHVTDADRKIIRLLYSGANANELILPIREPLKLTRK